MSLDNEDKRILGWVQRALDSLQSEKPDYLYTKPLVVAEKIWAAHPELTEKFGTPTDFLRKVAEESMLSTVGRTPSNRASTSTIHEFIETLSKGEIPVAAMITGNEPAVADGVTYSGIWHDMSLFSEMAGNYFYRGKRHEYIEAEREEIGADRAVHHADVAARRAALTDKFGIGSMDSGMGRGTSTKTE